MTAIDIPHHLKISKEAEAILLMATTLHRHILITKTISLFLQFLLGLLRSLQSLLTNHALGAIMARSLKRDLSGSTGAWLLLALKGVGLDKVGMLQT